MRKPKHIPQSQLPLKEEGRTKDGRLAYSVKPGSLNSDVMLSIECSSLRYQVHIELQDGRIIDSGYVDR